MATDTQAAPAELAAQLALADPAQGANAAVGERAARAALRLAQSGGLTRAAGHAAAWLSIHLFRQGEHERALQAACAALPLLELPELALMRCETLRVMAISLCEQGRFGPALEAAQQLAELAAQLGDAGMSLMGAYALGACFDRMGDPWQATRVLEDAIRAHAAAAPARAQLIAHIGMCAFLGDTFHRMRDAAPRPEREQLLRRSLQFGERAIALLPGAPEPLFRVGALHNLGEVRLHLGELAPAAELLHESIRVAAQAGLAAYGWRARATLCQWLLASGQVHEALHAVSELLADMGDRAAPATAMRAHETAYQACRQLGQFESALVHFERFERLDRQRTLAELRAQSELFVTRIEAQQTQSRADLARKEAELQSQRASEFAHLAEHDPLTGLGNRTHLAQRVAALAGQASAKAGAATLAMIDVDHFKQINDAHGHAAGDAVLVLLATLLREGTRGSDVLVRLGGEEFVVLLPDTPPRAALEVCERLRRRIAGCTVWPEVPAGTGITVSIGLAESRGTDLAAWLRRADTALYGAKREGRNRVCLATD